MLTIGQLAIQTGVGVETIRFYERQGLLAPDGRLSSGYRQYGPEAVMRITFIRRAQRLGFTLREAKDLLALRKKPEAGSEEIRKRVAAKLAEVDAQIADLQKARTELDQLLASCHRTGPAAGCPIIAAMESRDRDAPTASRQTRSKQASRGRT